MDFYLAPLLHCSTGRKKTSRHDVLAELRSPIFKFKEDKVSRIDGKDYCEKRKHTEKEIQKLTKGSP